MVAALWRLLSGARGAVRPGVLVTGGVAASTIVVVIAAAVIIGGGGGGPAAGSANLWVDANGGSCIRQAVAGAYNDAQACSNMNAAYTAASAGDTVRIVAGTYPSQTISATQKASGSNVIFRPANDTDTVTLTGELDVEASRVTVMNVNLGNNDAYMGVPNGPTSWQVVTNVVFDGVNGREFRIFNASNSTVRNGNWGPVSSCGGSFGGENNKIDSYPTFPVPTNITIEGNVIHDVQTWSIGGVGDGTGGDCHIECIAVFGAKSLTLRRNTFYNCAVYDVFVKDNAGLGFTGPYVIENNFFGAVHNFHAPGGGTTLAFCTHPPNTKIINNSFQDIPSWQDCTNDLPVTGWTLQGNYGAMNFDVCSFSTGVTYSYNAWTNRAACTGTGNVGNVANTFVSNATPVEFSQTSDLHITSASASLIGKIPLTSSLLSEPLDRDAGTRTDPYDIGADEQGSDATCSQTVSSAATLTTAVSTAPAASTICMANGSYGAMTWTGGGSRVSRVVVRPAPGAAVTLTGALIDRASHLELRDVQMPGQHWEVTGSATDVQMTNVTAANFYIWSEGGSPGSAPSNVTIKGGEYGPNHSYPDNLIASNGSTAEPSNITIDGAYIHDQTRTSTGTHFECLQVWAANGLVIRNSRFENCSVFSVFFQKVDSAGTSFVPPTPSNITIENNTFDCCTDFLSGSNSSYKNYAIQFANSHSEGAWTNVVIRNNTMDDKLDLDTSGVTMSGASVKNNILPALHKNGATYTGSTTGVTVDYNELYQGSAVGAHDITGASTASLFTDFGNLNFHLAAGSNPAVDTADPTDFPATDIDGETRPKGAAPDIGADER